MLIRVVLALALTLGSLPALAQNNNLCSALRNELKLRADEVATAARNTRGLSPQRTSLSEGMNLLIGLSRELGKFEQMVITSHATGCIGDRDLQPHADHIVRMRRLEASFKDILLQMAQ